MPPFHECLLEEGLGGTGHRVQWLRDSLSTPLDGSWLSPPPPKGKREILHRGVQSFLGTKLAGLPGAQITALVVLPPAPPAAPTWAPTRDTMACSFPVAPEAP